MNRICSDSGYIAQAETVAHLERDGVWWARYSRYTMENWLQAALDQAGISQAQLAREMTKLLGRSIDRAAINKLAKQKRRMQADELVAIIRLTGTAPPSDYMATIDGTLTGANFDPLQELRGPVPITAQHLPYGGAVRAGDFLPVDEYFQQDAGDHMVPLGVVPHPAYDNIRQGAWQARGNSMDQAGILDGMWIVAGDYADFVDKVGELGNGNKVIVERTRNGGSERELTVKEVQFSRRGMRLVPRSSDARHKEFFIPLDEDADSDTETVRILAVVLWAGWDMDPRNR